MTLLSRTRGVAKILEAQTACCPTCLLELARDLSQDPATLTRAIKDVHGLWNTCAWLLSIDVLDRDDRQRTAIARAWSRCPRHRLLSLLTGDVLHNFTNSVCACLHVCLSVGERSAVQRSATRERAYENPRGHWPAKSDALFPCGEHAGVRAVMYWCIKLGTPSPLLLLADMLRIAHPLIFNELAEAGVLREKVLLAIVRRIGDFGSHGDGASAPVRIPQNLPPTAPEYRRENMEAAVGVLAAIQSAPDALPNALLQISENFEMMLFNGLQLVLDAMDADDPLFGTILSLCAALYNYAPVRELRQHVRSDVLHAARAHKTLTLFGVLHRVLEIVARNRRICAREDCETQVAYDAPDAHFPVCERCQLVRYCGKECQRDDWRRGLAAPHKSVCPLIRKLTAAAGTDATLRDFETAAEASVWDVEELRTLSLFTLDHRILPMEILFRAADLHRELMGDSAMLEASEKALASVEDLKNIFEAAKARYL